MITPGGGNADGFAALIVMTLAALFYGFVWARRAVLAVRDTYYGSSFLDKATKPTLFAVGCFVLAGSGVALGVYLLPQLGH